ncbi:MAG TPA: glycoside hydrolase family 3 N-terminal domain-containing protein [Acidimicrobiia bacterium]|jgi:beta-glucosidase
MTAITEGSGPAVYQDPNRPIATRVQDLLERMTLEEKVAQLGSAWVFQLLDGEELAPEKAAQVLRDGLGHVTRISGASNLDSRDAARVANAIQRHLLEQTRLGIPAIVHEEICSGLMARGATVFPQAIGIASTWQPELAREVAEAVRAQMRAMGAHQGLSPVLDIARDPRWGRTEETFGEDPHLVAMMGMSFVRGLEGDDLTHGVIATAKHFVGYGASEGGLNWAPAHIPTRELHDVYLHPFEAAVKTSGARSVMNGYHELDGVPCGADRDLLTGLLRDIWGFGGYVVSDYFAVRQLHDYHQVAGSYSEAATLALTAGIDVELPGTDCYGQPLLDAVQSGLVSEITVDDAVARVLQAKFELGLFENPFVDPEQGLAMTDTPTHRHLARAIAAKSIVLLRNDRALPVPAGIDSIAVIGPNADDGRNLFGDYTYPAHIEALIEMKNRENVFSVPFADGLDPEDAETSVTTIREALVERLGSKVKYARGCDVNGSSTEGFAEAVALASSCDMAVMVMGDKAGLTEDCTSGEGRDRLNLDLPGVQEDLVRAVVATGTPVILVLVTGRPGGSPWIHENCAAVVMAWFPGQEGAPAIADVLTGVTNPGGKLPISYPRSAGQIPVYYSHKISGGRSHWKGDYVDGPVAPLYPFGHGLSYTSFQLSEVAVAPDVVSWNAEVTVTATLSNDGTREGDEVVQVYVRDPVASVTRPVLELKSFARVELPAGGSTQITFRLPAAQLGFHDRDIRYVVEPGQLEVLVGTSSRDLVEAGSFTMVPDPSGRAAEKTFHGTVEVV